LLDPYPRAILTPVSAPEILRSMVRREKFGRFVLLEEIEAFGLGTEYRAAKLSPTGFEKLVTVVRLQPALSHHADVVKALMDQVKFAAQLHHSNLLKIHGIGKVDAAYYISYEFLEAKSLRAVFERTRQDAFPFSVDHGLLIASKVCAALEHAHSRRVEAGVRYFHGFIHPANVVVSYEGEVRLRGFGTWPSRIREAGGATADEEAYLSPEQAGGGRGDTRSDTWAVGALLFEVLTGRRYAEAGSSTDAATRLANARLKTPASEDEAIPKAIAEILHKALAADPAARYGEVQELRKAVDTLLFSGDFSPTTFNLAFFMHSLFRQDIDREAEALKEEKEASYLPYLAEEPARAAAPPPPRPVPPVAPPVATAEEPPARKPLTLADALVPPPPASLPAAAASAAARHEPSAVSPQQAAAGFTFHHPAPVAARSRAPLAIVGMAALLLVGAGAGYVSLRGRPPAAAAAAAPPPTTLSPEAVAAMARVKELEERLRAIEAEKAAAEAAAADHARKKVEAQAAARGQIADAAVVARAEEGARRRAQAEQERRLREEQQTLAREQRAAEENLANEQRREEEERAGATAAAIVATTTTTTTTTLPPPTPEPVPALRAGALVNLNDPGVIAPVLDRAPVAEYPPIALRQRLEGTVELNVLVDERGSVIEAKVVAGAGGRAGLNEAAVESVKRRKYRPGIKEGVPVKVWIPVRVVFRLPS
jgi:TonB family protein